MAYRNEKKMYFDLGATLHETLKVMKSSYAILTMILVVFTACVPEPKLEYPEPAQDFSNSTLEPEVRSDATPPIYLEDMELDMTPDMETGLLLPDAYIRPTLRTRGLDFVGEPQSTYNGVEPTVRGRFLWTIEPVMPNEQQKGSEGATERSSDEK